jgi:hypothetical protein
MRRGGALRHPDRSAPAARLAIHRGEQDTTRLLCHVDPDQLSTLRSDNSESIEQAELDDWDHEQIHGRIV